METTGSLGGHGAGPGGGSLKPNAAIRLLQACADFVLPPACPACGGGADPTADGGICFRCRLSLRPPPPPTCLRCHAPKGTGARDRFCTECAGWPEAVLAARSCHLHEDGAARLVHRLKYDGWSGLASVMGRSLAALVRSEGFESDYVTWVPTTGPRRRIRGYDQAELLARSVVQETGIPLLAALVRKRSGGTQVALQPAGRLSNVKRAFSVRKSSSSTLQGACVLLVDDVLTTGATAVAASEVLVGAGASGVNVVAFARATAFRRSQAG